MQKVTLGRTSIQVSPICFGCWQMSKDGYWGTANEAELTGAARRAVELGDNSLEAARAALGCRQPSCYNRC